MKYNELIAKLPKYMKIEFPTYEEQAELIKILSELCDLQNDMLFEMKQTFDMISKREM